MDPLDHSVRMAAFRFLEEQTHLVGEDGALRRSLLERGFTYDGQRVPLLGPQGIFKPRVLRSIPLSITTWYPSWRARNGPTTMHLVLTGYCVIGIGERTLPITRTWDCARRCSSRCPLSTSTASCPACTPEWPVFIVGDTPALLTFTVSVDERTFASLGNVEIEESTIRRRYATRLFRQRLHQTAFRERVVRAYQHHCAVCRLKRVELIEAAHILPDADPLSEPGRAERPLLCAAPSRGLRQVPYRHQTRLRRRSSSGRSRRLRRPYADSRPPGVPRLHAARAESGVMAT